MAKKKGLYGVNTYVKKSRKKIHRHKKRLSKSEKRSYKKYKGHLGEESQREVLFEYILDNNKLKEALEKEL